VQQIVIDPRNHGYPTDPAPVIVVPPKVRAFGYVPDLRGCNPGDLILSFSITQNLTDRQIASTQQRMGLGSEDARWTHAAVFLYEDWIVEAIPFWGVVTRSLYSDVPDSILRIRRSPSLSIEQRCMLAVCAHRRLSRPIQSLGSDPRGTEGAVLWLESNWCCRRCFLIRLQSGVL
jgi:hypothetical protein